MALTLPITRDIVVSERRNYTLTYTFCDLGVVPSSSDIVAKAFPRFSRDALFIGFLGASATKPTTRFFSPGDKLWRNTATTRQGRFSEFVPLQDYGVAVEVQDTSAINMPFSISNSALTITIPFGQSFYRYVNPDTGVMSLDDMYLPNDPAKYIYAIMNNGVQLGGGIIDITIDLGKPVVDDKQPTVCSVRVT